MHHAFVTRNMSRLAMRSPRYTVILRGEHHFSLSKAQIEHDSPKTNFFVGCFLRDFVEGESRVVELDHHPTLFAIIVQHMSGYRILPLSPGTLPPEMTHEVAMENLVRDAQFFGLDDLYQMMTFPAIPLGFHLNGLTGPIVDFEDVINGQLHSGIRYTDDGLCSDMGNDVLFNVLVYGRNMSLELRWEWSMLLDDQGDPTPGFDYNFYVGLLPTQFQALQRQHMGWSNAESEIPIPKHHLLTSPRRWSDCAMWHINGKKSLFKNLPQWLNSLHDYPEDRVNRQRYDAIRIFDEAFPRTVLPRDYEMDGVTAGVLHLWIDEAFFSIGGGGTPFQLEFLDVKTRTFGAILAASRPPFRRQ